MPPESGPIPAAAICQLVDHCCGDVAGLKATQFRDVVGSLVSLHDLCLTPFLVALDVSLSGPLMIISLVSTTY